MGRATRRDVPDAPAATSSEAAPDGRLVMRENELEESPPRVVEDKTIELSYGSEGSHPKAEEGVTKSSMVVEHIATVDHDAIPKICEAKGEAA